MNEFSAEELYLLRLCVSFVMADGLLTGSTSEARIAALGAMLTKLQKEQASSQQITVFRSKN